MKKTIKSFLVTALLGLTLTNAFAGTGLSAIAIKNFTRGAYLASAIGGGLGVASISHGVSLVARGSLGWGAFFLILEEEELITTEDRKVLANADVATKEAFIEIMNSDQLSETEKAEEIKYLFN